MATGHRCDGRRGNRDQVECRTTDVPGATHGLRPANCPGGGERTAPRSLRRTAIRSTLDIAARRLEWTLRRRAREGVRATRTPADALQAGVGWRNTRRRFRAPGGAVKASRTKGRSWPAVEPGAIVSPRGLRAPLILTGDPGGLAVISSMEREVARSSTCAMRTRTLRRIVMDTELGPGVFVRRRPEVAEVPRTCRLLLCWAEVTNCPTHAEYGPSWRSRVEDSERPLQASAPRLGLSSRER